jgi:hypothetical protein
MSRKGYMNIEDYSHLVDGLDFKVCDNVVSLEDQINFRETLLRYDFPWYYNADVSTDNGVQKRPGMFHKFVSNDGKVNSPHFDMVVKLVRYAEQVTNKKFDFVKRAATFLQFPLSQDMIDHNVLDQYHIDSDRPDPFWVILYYANSYDGETVFSDTIFDGSEGSIVDRDNFKVVKKVQGLQGRFSFFDGRIYHAATQPRKDMKCIININVA